MVLIIAIGLRKTFRLITEYPGILFIATFSLWTIGPVTKSESTSCCQLFKQEKLGISAKLTWINFILSMACSVTTSQLFEYYYLGKGGLAIFYVPIIFILGITLVSLLHGDSLNNCFCGCFKWGCGCRNCVTTQYSVLNLATMEEDAEMQEIMNKTPNFDEQENGSHSRKHCINCSQCCMILLIVLLVLSVLFAIAFGFLLVIAGGFS